MTVIADGGVLDQTGPVNDAFRNCTPLPAGVIRVTGPIGITATASGYANTGGALRGQPGFQTTIIADYDGDLAKGGIIQIDTAGLGKYSQGSVIEDLVLRPAPGRRQNGISLTAAWNTTINRVWMPNGCQNGIITPWRPDLHPTLSDGYQCWSLMIKQVLIQQCYGNGFDLAAGQSPGGLHVSYSQAIQCLGVGMHLTTGQCEIINNVLSENRIGGLLFDSKEGPSQMALVAQNEIQHNQYYGINVIRSRNMRLIQNRFLATTYSSADPTGFPQPGGPFMKQAVHVNFDGAGEIYNLLAERNQHKTANGSTVTTSDCYGYDAAAGTLSADFPSNFVKNEFGPMPIDGITQNSTGFRKYVGISAPAGLIIDP
jgi:hypothetical protein